MCSVVWSFKGILYGGQWVGIMMRFVRDGESVVRGLLVRVVVGSGGGREEMMKFYLKVPMRVHVDCDPVYLWLLSW